MRSGSFAIILDAAGAVLLCHRTDIDLWNLPGGGVEDGESPWDAAVRETREEVGLEIEIDRLAGVYFKPEVTEIVFSFVARIVGGSPRTSEEADDVRYFPLDAIPANTSRKQLERIHDAVGNPANVVMKEQRGPSSREALTP